MYAATHTIQDMGWPGHGFYIIENNFDMVERFCTTFRLVSNDALKKVNTVVPLPVTFGHIFLITSSLIVLLNGVEMCGGQDVCCVLIPQPSSVRGIFEITFVISASST